MKTIVTHVSVDLDAVSSAWIMKRFRPGWEDAQLAFVSAGTTLNDAPVDSDPDIAHVDTGLGIFDHHQISDKHLSAAKRVFQYLENEKHLKEYDADALARMVEVIAVLDNFGEVHFADPTADLYEFMLHQIVSGLKGVAPTDEERCELMFKSLDAVFQTIKNKIRAEKEIEKGRVFQSKYGKSLGIETKNEEAMKLAMKMGYSLVVRRDPELGIIRIKTLPDPKLDLTLVYEKIIKVDPKATWFLHISKNMLLNGSLKNPDSVASALTLQSVIEIIEKI